MSAQYTANNTFQSTLSVRRATENDSRGVGLFDISIHALRKESDKVGLLVVRVSGNFNPRSP